MSTNPQSSKAEFRVLSGEGFETKFSHTRAEKKRELQKLMVAHSDIYAAFNTCNHFLSIMIPYSSTKKGAHAALDHPLYNPLLEAIVISYGRPFSSNSSLGALKKKWLSSPHLQKAHTKLLTARNELIAHSDMFVRQVKIQPPGRSPILNTNIVGVGYAIRTYMFAIPHVQDFYATSGDLAQRLHLAVEALLNELYEGMDLPAKGFDLRFDDGL
jgi:hypothetical protein